LKTVCSDQAMRHSPVASWAGVVILVLAVCLTGCGPYNPAPAPVGCVGATDATQPIGQYMPPTGARLALCDTLISKNDPDPHSDPYNWDYNAPGDNPDGTCQQSAQGYDVVVPASAPDTGLNCFAEGPTPFTNFAFSINMQVVKGSSSEKYDAGIAFRCPQTPDTCYEFTVDGSGNYSLYAYVNGNPVNTSAIPATDHTPLFITKVGSVNQLAVEAQNHTISLYINGHFLTSVTDSTSASGRIGVTEDSAKTGTVEVLFSDAKVWSL